MATLKEIRTKVKATKSIQKTTKAMQMIASVRFQKAQTQLIASRPYTLKIQHLLSNVLFKKALSFEEQKIIRRHPFLVSSTLSRGDNQGIKEGILVVTSDKGLCGGYNTNIIKKTQEYIKTKNIHNLEIFVIGAKGRDYFRRNGVTISHNYFDIFKGFSSAKTEAIANDITKLFLQNKLSKFSIIHSEYRSLFHQPTIIKQLLPVVNPIIYIEDVENNRTVERQNYLYEPSKEIIIDKIVNRYIKAEVFGTLLEAYNSEIASRRNSMENANKNATEVIDELSIVMNNLRQQRITTELTEIISGCE